MVAISILEDNDVLRRRMVNVLSAWERVTSIHEFSSHTDFCAHALVEDVDVFLADLHVLDGSGFDSIARLSQIQPDSISIVITALSDSESVVRAISNGAVGYLHKDDGSFEIVSSIKMALNGQSPISPSVARKLVTKLKIRAEHDGHGKKVNSKESKGILTPRQTEVLNLLAKGLSYSECADVLSMSEQTVPVHVRNIYRKLHAKNRSEAVYEARFLGVIE